MNKKKKIDDQFKSVRKKLNDLKKQKLKVKIDLLNQKKENIVKSMNKFVAGSSNFD